MKDIHSRILCGVAYRPAYLPARNSLEAPTLNELQRTASRTHLARRFRSWRSFARLRRQRLNSATRKTTVLICLLEDIESLEQCDLACCTADVRARAWKGGQACTGINLDPPRRTTTATGDTHTLADQSSRGMLFVLGLLVLVFSADYAPFNLELLQRFVN